MLAFVDLETTGLDAEKHDVLEVACIITDDKFVEVARFAILIQGYAAFHTTDEFVRNMHTINGLWEARKEATGKEYRTAEDADNELAAFIRQNAVRVLTDDKGRKSVDRPQLAGNTISFDRAFMKKYLPRAEAELHYRNLDVSSLNEMARRFWPDVHKGRPNNVNIAHRALADAEESLKVARYYAQALGPAASAFPVAEHLP